VVAVVVAGSYRRCRETVGDIDILASASDGRHMMDHFVAYDEVREIVAKGGTRSTVILKCGLQVDLRVVRVESFGAALQYFTGSKAHNIEIRRRAQERKLKISENGVFAGQRRISSDTEESVYRAVGLPWIPAELRENRGEIEAAQAGKLPVLVELRDLKGDLHAHTKATDGHHSLKEMAQAAASRGLEYLAITEHSRRLTIAHGLDPQRLRRQIAEIDQLNAELGGVTVLKGVEVDILEAGRLDLPDEVLGELDLVVGAVHSQFTLSRTKQTERILRAMDHPHFTILAHPTGRLLDGREPYDVDMLRIIRHARERGCFLEINAQPNRLDLLDIHCQLARDEGVLVAISSDAHRCSFCFLRLFGLHGSSAQSSAISRIVRRRRRGLRRRMVWQRCCQLLHRTRRLRAALGVPHGRGADEYAGDLVNTVDHRDPRGVQAAQLNRRERGNCTFHIIFENSCRGS
jgi:DNA polymerase (family X)